MQRTIRCSSALLSTFLFAMMAVAQAPTTANPDHFGVSSADIAITFTTERAKIQSSSCSCFWLYGGGANAAITFYRGLGIATNLTAVHASNITPGVNLGLLSFMVGPRYTFNVSRSARRNLRVFAEELVGYVHGFDSVFPGPNGTTFSSGAFSTQTGIGMDISNHKGFGVRLFEADFVHTSLPNSSSNSQNDLRLAFGLSYRLTAR